jgi:hypothetical protein
MKLSMVSGAGSVAIGLALPHQAAPTIRPKRYFGKIVAQSSFMLTTAQPFAFASSHALSSPPIYEARS